MEYGTQQNQTEENKAQDRYIRGETIERMNEMVSKVEAFNPYTDEEEKKEEGICPGGERYGRKSDNIRIKENEEGKTGP